MEYVNKIINECGISKVKIAKYLGISRQMLYNYLVLDSIDELPKDKQNKLLFLFGVETKEQLKNIKVNESYISELESRVNDGIIDTLNKGNITDLKGLTKNEQETLTEIFSSLKNLTISLNEKDGTGYATLKYLQHFIQAIPQVPELKYILAYMAKNNGIVPPLTFIYDEDKQYTFEGILFSAMNLYTSGNASKNKVSESHHKFEEKIAEKKEEELSRTEELTTLRSLALNELGLTTINESNAKEVFEKIAEIMSRKF